MIYKNICDWDRKASEKLKNIQLPNQWKSMGYAIMVIALVLILSRKIFDISFLSKTILQNILIVGLLIVSLSKEKIEDELIIKVRAMTYRMAFIFAVFYGLLQPIINYVVDIILGVSDKDSHFTYFQLIIFMLLIQVGFFELFKRKR
ncbi:MAG: hypothetical protein R2781_02500 [Flavobacteriaceae bacterium]